MTARLTRGHGPVNVEAINADRAQRPSEAEGAWCLIDADYGESITAVYPTEVEALRVLNGRGYGRVAFLPWGATVLEARA